MPDNGAYSQAQYDPETIAYSVEKGRRERAIAYGEFFSAVKAALKTRLPRHRRAADQRPCYGSSC